VRRRELVAAAGFLLGLALVGLLAGWLGSRAGEPHPPRAPALERFNVTQPPVKGGLLGFEGLGARLQLGSWAEVRAVEPAQVKLEVQEGRYVMVDGVRVTLQAGEATSTLDIGRPDLLRTLTSSRVEAGARVAVHAEGQTATLLLIR
jgi:hypothetical protein